MIFLGDQNHEPPPALEMSDLSWNTHVSIREFFSYPTDDEFFAVWLEWFYNALNAEQRRTLRNTPLNTLNPGSFPSPPSTS